MLVAFGAPVCLTSLSLHLQIRRTMTSVKNKPQTQFMAGFGKIHEVHAKTAKLYKKDAAFKQPE